METALILCATVAATGATAYFADTAYEDNMPIASFTCAILSVGFMLATLVVLWRALFV